MTRSTTGAVLDGSAAAAGAATAGPAPMDGPRTVDGVKYVPHVLDRDGVIYVAGHRGLVGSAVVRRLERGGFRRSGTRSHDVLDLRDRESVFTFFAATAPRYVVLAAAKVGGIAANESDPTGFFSDNVRIQVNVIDAALRFGTERLLFLGSSCIYPKLSRQPISENQLLSGYLEHTNDAYAIAKIAGILHVQSVRRQYGKPWICAMPTNLYGPGDNFSPHGSHVLPALIRRYDEAVRLNAPVVVNWGTGRPRREFLHGEDRAEAGLHLLEHYDGPLQVNVGTGTDVTISELAAKVAAAVGFAGTTRWDASKPDGTPRKLLSVELLRSTGWAASIGLDDGIADTVAWYRPHRAHVRGAAGRRPSG
jgi:GDP-L-fucose synthase